ncbi:hypothetical protein BVRB_3g063300 [Beta vulgaris subsp. vulgaris]|nr:hypothetical protein BVRB_3g063300 [Beta vulgaris subsp. vulgaris]
MWLFAVGVAANLAVARRFKINNKNNFISTVCCIKG